MAINRDNLFAHCHSATFLYFKTYLFGMYGKISSDIVDSAVILVVNHFQFGAFVHTIDIQNKEKGPRNRSLGYPLFTRLIGNFTSDIPKCENFHLDLIFSS